jgi:hypothetical protein
LEHDGNQLKLSLVGSSACATRLDCVLFVAGTEFAIAEGRRLNRHNSGCYFFFIQKLGRNICVVRKVVRQTLAHRENYDAF